METLENVCPNCGEDYNFRIDDCGVEQDGDKLFAAYFCTCKVCHKNWKYVEVFKLDYSFIEEGED